MFQTDGQKLPGTMCDHQFVSSDYSPSHGKFYSPRYPSTYPKNIRCSYRFRARTKERIRVVFEEVTLQKGDLSCINRADIIRVHDGRSSTAPAIKMLCNTVTETEILSTGPDLYIEFIANSEWPGQGFKATYQFQPIDEISSSSASSASPSGIQTAAQDHDSKQQGSTVIYSVVGPAVSAATSVTTANINHAKSPTEHNNHSDSGAIVINAQEIIRQSLTTKPFEEKQTHSSSDNNENEANYSLSSKRHLAVTTTTNNNSTMMMIVGHGNRDENSATVHTNTTTIATTTSITRTIISASTASSSVSTTVDNNSHYRHRSRVILCPKGKVLLYPIV